MHEKRDIDLMIIGGGPGGMAAALVAGRASLDTVVVNAESPRNAVTKVAHGLLTRDGEHPLELLAIAKAQLKKYSTVTYRIGTIESVDAVQSGFVVHDSAGLGWRAQRVILATGYRDDLPRLNLQGIEAVYGRSAYPCPFCDGYEHAGERVAAFTRGVSTPLIEHYLAMIMRLCSDDITVFVNRDDLDATAKRRLVSNGIRIVDAKVSALVSDGHGKLTGIELEDGTRVASDVAFIAEDYTAPATEFATQLGVPTTTNPFGWTLLDVDEHGQTGVENFYVVGDARSQFAGLTAATAQGASCAAKIVNEFAMERWHRGANGSPQGSASAPE